MPSPCFTSGDTKETRRAQSRRRHLRRTFTGRLAVWHDELSLTARIAFFIVAALPTALLWIFGGAVEFALGCTLMGMMFVLFRGRTDHTLNMFGLFWILMGLGFYVANIWVQLS